MIFASLLGADSCTLGFSVTVAYDLAAKDDRTAHREGATRRVAERRAAIARCSSLQAILTDREQGVATFKAHGVERLKTGRRLNGKGRESNACGVWNFDDALNLGPNQSGRK